MHIPALFPTFCFSTFMYEEDLKTIMKPKHLMLTYLYITPLHIWSFVCHTKIYIYKEMSSVYFL